MSDPHVQSGAPGPKSKIMENFVWPAVFIVGFGVTVAVLTLMTSGSRDDHRSLVEMTYEVKVERMPVSLLNNTIIVTRKFDGVRLRCALPSDGDMKQHRPMECKDSDGTYFIEARRPI